MKKYCPNHVSPISQAFQTPNGSCRQCNSPCLCIPGYPPDMPCPPCPIPEFPSVVCTAAFESFADQSIQTPASSVNIPNAFNTNDGPAPYTVLSAAFMNLQLPLASLSFTPLGNNTYTLAANISPMVQVTYLDGNSTQRAKFVQAPLNLTAAVISPVDPSAVDWWAFMESGSISNPVASGTALSFTAIASLNILAIPPAPGNYAVLQDFSCAQPAPVTAICRNIYDLAGYCQVSTAVPSSVPMAIPYVPLGPAPYSNPSVLPIDSPPYVLRALPQPGGVMLTDLAFPVTLNYSDGNTQLQTQSTFLFMTLLFQGLADEPNTHIIADLAVSNILLSGGTFTGPVLSPLFLLLEGTIAVINSRREVLTTSAVLCGPLPVSTCQPIFIPPTQEIPG